MTPSNPNQPVVKFIYNPQVEAVVMALPFIVFTVALLVGSPLLTDYMIFFNITYAAMLTTYTSANLWGDKVANWHRRPPSKEDTILKEQLFSYVAPAIAWIAVIIPYPALSLFFMICTHGWFLASYLKAKQDNALPVYMAQLKVHPFMISIPCLALNFVKVFFNCPMIS